VNKIVNFQRYQECPEEYRYYAINRDGSLVAFVNPPIRDFDRNIWIDSTDGKEGALVIYKNWKTSVRKYGELVDKRVFVEYHKGGRNVT